MKSKKSNKKFNFDIKNLPKYMPAAVFCLFISVVFIMFLAVPKKDYSEQEKRKLSDMPEFSVSNLLSGDFGKKFENYLADHMPMRTQFVGLNSYYDLYSGRNGANGVYKGDDGYLITTPVKYSENLDKNVGYINDFAESIDVQTFMCVIPTSGFIMSDELPSLHYEYTDDSLINVAKYDLEQLDSSIKFIDITQDFQLASGTEQLYYRTDHHWTSRGAYECYKALGRVMGFAPTNISEFKIESCDGFYGTSYGKAGLWGCPSESIEFWKNKSHTSGTVTVNILEEDGLTTSNSMFFMDNIESDDKYTAFLDGNHGLVTITNNYESDGKKLLIVRDSYTHCLAPFLADNYSEIVLVDLRYYKDNVSDLVNSYGIDQVLVIYGLDNMVNSTDIAYLF